MSRETIRAQNSSPSLEERRPHWAPVRRVASLLGLEGLPTPVSSHTWEASGRDTLPVGRASPSKTACLGCVVSCVGTQSPSCSGGGPHTQARSISLVLGDHLPLPGTQRRFQGSLVTSADWGSIKATTSEKVVRGRSREVASCRHNSFSCDCPFTFYIQIDQSLRDGAPVQAEGWDGEVFPVSPGPITPVSELLFHHLLEFLSGLVVKEYAKVVC